MRLGVIVVLIAVVVCSAFPQQTSDEWYMGKPIRDIVFNGIKHVDIVELQEIVEPYIGRLFNDDVFWEIQGRLYSLEYFDLINPSAVPTDQTGSEVIIRFTVTERPVVSRIIFQGNDSVRNNDLMDSITLKVRDVINEVKLRLDEQAVREKYLEKGFPDVKVRSETQTNSDSTITITFIIEEGEKITIEQLLFEGNTAFSDRTLRGQLSLKIRNSFLLSDGAFQEAKLIADRENLTQYYHDRGYIDAEVSDIVREVTKDERGNNNMTIIFRINEGRIYTFNGVSFEGNQIFSTEQLSALIYSEKGKIVNSRRLDADIQRVADLYYENGYIFNTIDRIPNRNTENGLFSYTIQIVERGRAHIENVIIKGNKKTKTDVILREIPMEPGDVFSKTKVMEAYRNLMNLQYFSNVVPEPVQGSADSLMDLVFTVEEQPTTDIQFGLTFSGTSDPDTFPVSGMLKWNDRNIRGSGNIIGAELNASPDTQLLMLNYTQRWIFGLPLDGSADLSVQHMRRKAAVNNSAPFFNGNEDYAFPDGFISYDEYKNADFLPPDEYLMYYDQWQMSIGFGTGYRWNTFLGIFGVSGGIRMGVIYNSYDDELYRPFNPALRDDNNRFSPANSFWTNIYLDQRDIYYDPSSGYYISQRFGYYGIFNPEREHYIKTDTKIEWFYTLFNIPITEKFNFKAVFGLHSGLSFILPQFFREDISIESSNELAVDGMFNGRGWNRVYYNKGHVLFENWAEIRIPLVPGLLAWDFFFDVAGVKKTPYDFFHSFSFDDMLYSFGGEFRFTIPQFPFRFGLAKRFKVQDGVIQWQAGALGHSDSNPTSGIDFIISFALSRY
ncbi:MAG: outer membrane protein assembly factor BamA [Treponema sp.]|jgi:outer membrane protein insertion porin family|nr:outer membrane protein assembly factor BamA [Treponema sp.]